MNESSKHPKKLDISSESLQSKLIDSSDLHINISQTFITTTEDKIRICLLKHLKQIESKRSWIAPFAILITIIAALATTTFKSAFGLSADTWYAIFIIVGCVTVCWLIWAIIMALRSKKIDDIIDEFKKTGH